MMSSCVRRGLIQDCDGSALVFSTTLTDISEVFKIANKVAFGVDSLVNCFLSLHLGVIHTVNNLLGYGVNPEGTGFLTMSAGSAKVAGTTHLDLSQALFAKLVVQSGLRLHVQAFHLFQPSRTVDGVTKRVF
jgi:hypothetical protein